MLMCVLEREVFL